MGIDCLLLAAGLVVILWPRRKAGFLDPLLWCALTGLLRWNFVLSHDRVYPLPAFSNEFTTLLGLMFPVGVIASLFRMDPATFIRFGKACLVCVGVGLVVLFFSLPGVGSSPASLRSQCRFNLKILGLAIHNYHDSFASFPAPRSGEVSWRVAILPFADQAPLFLAYDKSFPWNSPANSIHSQEHIPVYECASRVHSSGQSELGRSDLALPIGKGGLFETETSLPRIRDIADGSSNTLAIVEASGRCITWNEPRDVNFDELPIGINLPGSQPGWSDGVFSSYHPGGVQATFADGGTRFLSQEIDPQVLRSLLLAGDGRPESSEW